MKPFWSLAGRHWLPSLPSWEMEAAIGEERAAKLVATGILREVAIQPYERLACASCRWHARVIWEPQGAVVLCEGEMGCPAVELGKAPYRLVGDERELARRLAEAFVLEGAPGAAGVILPLGKRRIGDELVAVDLSPYPAGAGFEDVLFRLTRTGPRVRVLLVPESARIPADAPTECGATELVWAGLDEVVVIEDRLRVDLRPIVARRTFPGFDVNAGFDGLVVDSGGAWWRGDALPVHGRALRLLRALATRHPSIATKKLLWREVWPEDHTKAGEIARGIAPHQLDSRLRHAVAEIRAALGEAAVENERGGDQDGGYRLALGAGQVRAA